MKEIIKVYFKKLDFVIIIAMSILICVGLFCTRQAFKLSEEQNNIFIKQLAGLLIGFMLIMVILFIDYHIISTLSSVFYIVMVCILALTLIVGTNLNNVKRWIMILGIPFQPSELSKIALILFLAYLCNHFKSKLNKLFVFIILIAVAALPTFLILLEPHLSSSLAMLFIFCLIIFSSGISYKVIGTVLALFIPFVVSIFIGVALFKIDIPFIEQYQVNRVLFHLSDDEKDGLSGDYQQMQSLKALGSGGLQGRLISADGDDEREYSRIYAKESDFVFAIVGEEFGFIGSFFIIMLYAVLIIRSLLISRASDYTGKLICIGVAAYFMFQIFVNIGVATNLLPNTGLPLPFISYGITSLISSMSAIGLVLNIGIRQKNKNLKLNFSTAAN